MGCTNCNQPQEYNLCNPAPCQEPQDCSCQTILKSDCVTYSGDDLACSGIKKGTIVTELIQQLDAFICEKVNDITNALTLKNIGVGAEIYKGIDLLGRKEIRKVKAVGSLATVTQNTDDISISINETALNTFIEANQKTYSVANIASTGASLYKDTIDVGDNTQFNFKKIKALDNSIIIIEEPNEVTVRLNTNWLLQFLTDNRDFVCDLISTCGVVIPEGIRAVGDYAGVLVTNSDTEVNVLANDDKGTLPTNIISITPLNFDPLSTGINVFISLDSQKIVINMGNSYVSGFLYQVEYTIQDATLATSTAILTFEDIS